MGAFPAEPVRPPESTDGIQSPGQAIQRRRAADAREREKEIIDRINVLNKAGAPANNAAAFRRHYQQIEEAHRELRQVRHEAKQSVEDAFARR